MFILNEKPLALDCAFTTEDGTQYPANWLRLASPEEREAIGITESEDEPWYDQRFYWGVGNPKDHTELVKTWTAQVKQTAGSILAQSDWYITRASETGLEAPQSVLERRQLVRTLSNEKEAFLASTASTDELAEYVTGGAFNNWTEEIEELFDTAITGSGVPGASSKDIINV